jgi:GNAT superfamily N-acetyltransferase
VGESAGPRVAGSDDAATVTELIVGAFYDDPTWSWVFPDPATRRQQHRQLWRLFVDGALRYPWVWLAANDTAASVWVPPGGTDLSAEQESAFEGFIHELLGADAPRALHAFEAFEAAHPHDQPHYYLSLLATDPARRGNGYGLGLLADNLATIDAEGLPAYLEASNPANVPLYQRYGFEPSGTFRLDGGPTVTTMWRPGGG